ncbi:uncharacterized protein LOC117105875, partial [Anneissia japonica]|uniref:uncharacterized protein LOC117105875 n=1 Tax=Anneissia japonica TaxID=1529436 RepID=UPI001425B8AA
GRSIDDLVVDNLRVNEGDSAVLPCFFSPPNAHIGKWYWKTNGTVIIRSDDPPKTNSRYSLGDSTSGNVSLVIKDVLRWDKGTYTCGVNDQSTGSTVPHSDDSKLTVNYLDKPNIQALTDTRIPEGTRVSMSCKVVASYPEVNFLRWFHDGDIIDTASGRYFFYDEILEIKKFDQRHEGNYSCRAENEFFVGKNGKYSNSIAFSLKKKEVIPPSSPSSQIWIVFIIIPFLIIGVVVFIPWYFFKKRSKNIHRLDDFINNKVIKKDQKNEINVEQALDDFETVAYLKEVYETITKTACSESLDFKNDKVIMVARGECIKASFKSNYSSELSCFKEKDGYNHPFPNVFLLSRTWPENRLNECKPISSDTKRGNYIINDSCGSIGFELKGNIKKGATAEGCFSFTDVTDDIEGQYVFLLQIKHAERKSGTKPKTRHSFFGKTCIQLTNAIYRNKIHKKQFISPIGIVFSDQVYAFAVKTEKGEEHVEDNTIIRYITCAGKLQSENKNITIKWSDVAQVLLKPQ